jgi:DNA-directed RNA polymerase subunit K/omega
MVIRPADVNPYEFIVVCALRAQQLQAGCTPRVPGDHTVTVMAQMEVVAGHVTRAAATSDAPRQCGWQR